MAMRRKVAAVMGNGHLGLVEEDVPKTAAGRVLVEVHASLVSPGTELGGWRGLAARMERPDPGAEPAKFGYSNAGVVLEVGEGVTGLKEGDRVAAVGAGKALHTDYAVVPHNLVLPLPDGVTFRQGVYAMLSATALHAVRRAEPEIGHYCGVVGLGIVGQLTARLMQLSGCYVIGWDTIGQRIEIARRWGIDETAHVGSEDAEAKTAGFTGGYGLDLGVLAFGGDGNRAYRNLEKCFKVSPDSHPMGTMVMVGGCSFEYRSSLTNMDYRRASRVGPGYHDDAWETGADYAPVFIRWGTRTNIALCLRFMAEGRLDVDVLTTDVVPLDGIEGWGLQAMKSPDDVLGVVIEAQEQA
ncbi:MAG: hypothetical protein JW909_07030 [Planctomycetes bacterium]|nr:hypothetical protein [Planctomycetota bacterium]